MSSDFKQRFGLDYLTSNKTANDAPKSDENPFPKGLQDAVFTYGIKVMAALNRAPNQTMRLFELAGTLAQRVDTLLPVMSYLSNSGYVERQEDPVGNDAFKLTDSGKSVANNAV